jgi:hypothetical protein
MFRAGRDRQRQVEALAVGETAKETSDCGGLGGLSTPAWPPNDVGAGTLAASDDTGLDQLIEAGDHGAPADAKGGGEETFGGEVSTRFDPPVVDGVEKGGGEAAVARAGPILPAVEKDVNPPGEISVHWA